MVSHESQISTQFSCGFCTSLFVLTYGKSPSCVRNKKLAKICGERNLQEGQQRTTTFMYTWGKRQELQQRDQTVQWTLFRWSSTADQNSFGFWNQGLFQCCSDDWGFLYSLGRNNHLQVSSTTRFCLLVDSFLKLIQFSTLWARPHQWRFLVPVLLQLLTQKILVDVHGRWKVKSFEEQIGLWWMRGLWPIQEPRDMVWPQTTTFNLKMFVVSDFCSVPLLILTKWLRPKTVGHLSASKLGFLQKLGVVVQGSGTLLPRDQSVCR